MNKSNEFNSPFGKYNNPNIVDEENLVLCRNYLQKIDIKYQNYNEIIPNKNDLVWVDASP